MPKRVLIRIGVCDLDVELSYHICAGAYILERSVRPIITYMIWVKIDESQIGFYLKFLALLSSTKGMIINFLLNSFIRIIKFSKIPSLRQ